VISGQDWAGVLETVANSILPLCSVEKKDPRSIKLAIMILEFADGVEPDREDQTRGIQALRKFLDGMFAEAAAERHPVGAFSLEIEFRAAHPFAQNAKEPALSSSKGCATRCGESVNQKTRPARVRHPPGHCGSPTFRTNSANRESERRGSSTKSVSKPSSSQSRS